VHVNNETGVIQNIKTIGSKIKEIDNNILFHVDAVQSYGKINIDIDECKIDMLSSSAHKIHGPRGVGFAYIRKGISPRSLIIGGGQEYLMRSGTENLAGIVGMETAALKIFKHMKENYIKVSGLKSQLIKKLSQVDGIRINGEEGSFFCLT
jgi:cysteine desulfurase